jgi:hypothetical protein
LKPPRPARAARRVIPCRRAAMLPPARGREA